MSTNVGTLVAEHSCLCSSKVEFAVGIGVAWVRFPPEAPGRRAEGCFPPRATDGASAHNAGILKARGRSSKPCRASSILAVRSTQVPEGRVSVCQSGGAGSIPAACSNVALFWERHGLQSCEARFDPAVRLRMLLPAAGTSVF